MADENDTTITGGATRIVVPEGTVVSPSLRGATITLASPQSGFAVRFIEQWTPEPHILTPEQDERRRQIEAWHKRNMVLLKLMLTPMQRGQFAASHAFDVIGSKTKRTYRIHWGSQGNVRLLDEDGVETVSYCAQPEDVSVPETMLAQKLQIECDEPAFLAVANATCMATGDRVWSPACTIGHWLERRLR